ncbi:hypothetical protein WM40_12155 [Robbsia andropogonis]|uniref:SCP2 domain-containing protein n=1 Tax=Robbsia andropogonis TaxID=28092 RepID=A0A0F5JZF1_9BURK|nr:SCP2 sterol-binding domain-containing protein [Robbsia andropogonis]KKB63261.1 hypothetical protein WM40_12155 [Robbsia andropogonis]MCP1118250.1 SCP2 sterol-binding domain-containing protein [Robbsia andropogonis]MCP1127469.1 SCP2 sterol-binding domain-containing protein [Robbsia andropogonis]
MTTNTIITETIAKVKAALTVKTAPSKSIRIDIKEIGTIFASAEKVVEQDLSADTTLTISAQHLRELASKQLNPHMAFLQGKIKIKGDPAYALQWLPILQWNGD